MGLKENLDAIEKPRPGAWEDRGYGEHFSLLSPWTGIIRLNEGIDNSVKLRYIEGEINLKRMNMDTFLYFFFSILDALSIIGLIFALFRFPLLDYKKEIALFTFLTAIISYIIRNVLLVQEIDPFVQFMLLVLFFRFIVKIRVLHALSVSATGYLGFIFVQMIIVGILRITEKVHLDELSDVSNSNVYLIQLTTELICFLLAYLVHLFNLGFSFIPAPPHDIFIHDKLNRSNVVVLIAVLNSAIFVSLAVYLTLNLHNYFYLLILGAVFVFITLMYMLYLKDRK